jgi:hypothetical protein
MNVFRAAPFRVSKPPPVLRRLFPGNHELGFESGVNP